MKGRGGRRGRGGWVWFLSGVRVRGEGGVVVWFCCFWVWVLCFVSWAWCFRMSPFLDEHNHQFADRVFPAKVLAKKPAAAAPNRLARARSS